jgi:hypothetical protein
MVADSVPTSEVAKAAAVCNQSLPPKSTNASGKKKKHAALCPKTPAE